MSDSWNEGYVSESGYTFGYFRETNPLYQNFFLLLKGFEGSNTTPNSTHCELGFGQGVSLNIHAAASSATFWGTDFNPSHAAFAQRAAVQSGNGAKIFDDSFQDFIDRNDMPSFDSISLHGIWTWVNEKNQALIVNFLKRHLKPGGIVYMSYNCFPGWAPPYPIRHLLKMHRRFNKLSGAPETRIVDAVNFAKELVDTKPSYLQAAPSFAERVALIAKADPRYLDHEYFHDEAPCMYFTDIVDRLAHSKLEFITSAEPLDLIDNVNVSSDGLKFLNEIENAIFREQIRDYFVNRQFRKDIFGRGFQRLLPFEQRERLFNTRIILLKDYGSIPKSVETALGRAELQQDLYQPLIEILSENDFMPKTISEINAKLKTLSWHQILQIISVLLHLGAISPCQPISETKLNRSKCHRLNKNTITRSQFTKEVEHLASPITGGGIFVTRFEQIFLLGQMSGQKTSKQLAAFAWDILQKDNQRIIKEGSLLESEQDNKDELLRLANDFVGPRSKILGALDLV